VQSESGLPSSDSIRTHATALSRSTGSQPARASGSILQLQRQYGNRYVQRVLTSAHGLPLNHNWASKPVMRSGQAVPGTLKIENINPPDTDAIINLLHSVGYKSAGGHSNRADFKSQVGPAIEQALGANLNPRTISFQFTETTGINMDWSGTITFHMGNASPIAGGGTGSVTQQGGGSATTTNTSGTSTTDSSKVTGGVKSGDAKEGAEASGGGELSTSTTTSQQSSTATTTTGTSSATTTNVLNRFRAPLIVVATVKGEADFSGTDYINPFKWGVALEDIFDGHGTQSGEVQSGSIEFYKSEGIAPTPPAPPAQKKGWIEQQLGASTSLGDAAVSGNGASIDSVQLSRSGARPLPPSAASAAEQHHRTSLPKVNLIHGGQSDAYCDAMSAAAFCTPSPDGSSDIFMHSQVPLNSPEGQHTLHHEISHALQLQRGETTGLDGLGGDDTLRARLEKSADDHAAAIVGRDRDDHATK